MLNRRGFLGSLAALVATWCGARRLDGKVMIQTLEHERWLFASDEWTYDAATRTLRSNVPRCELLYPMPERVPPIVTAGMGYYRIGRDSDGELMVARMGTNA